MIFVNGSSLTQSLSGNNLPREVFSSTKQNGRAVIRPSAGIDAATATVEVSTRPRLLDSHGISHLTIRGLSFTAASSCVSAGAVEIWDGSNVLVEDSSFRWNNWDGLKLFNSANSIVRRTVSSHNGSAGLIGHQLTGVAFEEVETSFNNWRGALGKFYYFENGGAKLMRTHNSTFKNFRAVANQTMGLWFDSDNSGIVVEDSYLSRNEINGVFLEANQGPITIKNSKICNNGREGILSFATQNVTLTGNLLYANGGAQLFIDERNPFRSDHDWETGAPYTASSSHWTLSQNTIVGDKDKQSLIKRFPPPPGSATNFWKPFLRMRILVPPHRQECVCPRSGRARTQNAQRCVRRVEVLDRPGSALVLCATIHRISLLRVRLLKSMTLVLQCGDCINDVPTDMIEAVASGDARFEDPVGPYFFSAIRRTGFRGAFRAGNARAPRPSGDFLLAEE